MLFALFRPRATGPPRASPHAGKLKRLVLDTVLMHWTPHDPLLLRDLLAGGAIVLGRPGSGKSSSSSYRLLKACVDLEVSGGLICAASPSDLEMVEHIFARHPGRLVVFDEHSGLRFNVLNYLARHGSLKDVCEAIYAIAETIDRGSGGGSGGDGEASFFDKGARLIVEYAVTVVYYATGGVSPGDLLSFINTAARSREELQTDAFKASFHGWCFSKADAREKNEAGTYDYDLAIAYYSTTLPDMADRTRSSLIAVVCNTLHILNTGMNRMLFGTRTTVTPTLMDEAKYIVVNMPTCRLGLEASFALGVWKFIAEWHCLKRDTRAYNPPLFIHVDEIHNTINSHDAKFLAEGRKFASAMIACSQGRSSFYANMRGDNAEAQVNSLMNNFSHKIIHAIGDPADARWCSELVGEADQFEIGGGEGPPRGVLDVMGWRDNWAGNFHQRPRPIMLASEFMHGLRTGGPGNGNMCDAVLIRSGMPFSTGECFLRLEIEQPDLGG